MVKKLIIGANNTQELVELEGAEFEWSIWNANEANIDGLGLDSDDAYYSAEATYDQSYPNEADFECGGLSRVLDIVARTVFESSEPKEFEPNEPKVRISLG